METLHQTYHYRLTVESTVARARDGKANFKATWNIRHSQNFIWGINNVNACVEVELMAAPYAAFKLVFLFSSVFVGFIPSHQPSSLYRLNRTAKVSNFKNANVDSRVFCKSEWVNDVRVFVCRLVSRSAHNARFHSENYFPLVLSDIATVLLLEREHQREIV